MTGFSSSTLADYGRYARQLVINAIDETKEVIGGPEVIVEVDESKFSRRKYHRGHHVASKKWVFGGIERTPESRFFAIVVNDRKAETLDTVMKAYIKPTSIIYSDEWKGYTKLVEKGICSVHQTVNHSKNYVNPVDGTCTNKIEGHQGILKGHISKRQRTDEQLNDLLLEEVWRHQNKDDLWEGLRKALKTVKYVDFNPYDTDDDDNENTNPNTTVVQV